MMLKGRFLYMSNARSVSATHIMTGPKCRFSYCNIWEPKSINGGTPKYSISVLIPKTDTETVQKIRAAMETAYRDGEARLKGKGALPPMSAIKLPLRDGDLERPDDPAYAGCFFVNANSDRAPGIVDANSKPIVDRSEVYSGCYGRVSMDFYAFNTNGNRGIAVGLVNVQKIRDGEPLGGHLSAEAEFAGLGDDGDEPDVLK